MVKRNVFWSTVIILCVITGACEPEKLGRGKEMAVEAERHKVKRITQEDMEARVLAAGDTVVRLVQSAFLQLAEGQPKQQELFVAQPDKLPAVQAILQRYNARLERKTFAQEAEARHYLSPLYLDAKERKTTAQVAPLVQQQEFLYQCPILISRRNCASCEEPSLLDYTATNLENLRVFSAQGKPDGFKTGQVRGVWQLYFPRKQVIEQITLKTKVSKRGKGGFFGSKAETTGQK